MEAVELAYDEYETKETDFQKCPIIFTHGLFWNKFMLMDLAEALCHTTKRKVYCLDLRCHDRSPFRQQCSAELMAEDIKRFIRDRRLTKVSFVCHSASCTVAYLVTVDEPEVVEKLVMIDHPIFPKDSDYIARQYLLPQFAAQDRFLDNLDPSLSLQAAKKKILGLRRTADSEGQRMFLQKVAYELTKVEGGFGWKTDHKFLVQIYCENFVISPRGRSDHEILIIRCQDSQRMTDNDYEEILRLNPNAKLVSIKDCTHLLMFEKEKEFLEIVKDFLS